MTGPRIGDTPEGGPVQACYARKDAERRPAIVRGVGRVTFTAFEAQALSSTTAT